MVNQNLAQLKKDLNAWKVKLQIREAMHKETIVEVKNLELEFKEARSSKYHAYKLLREARGEVEKLTGSIMSFESRVRQWNKNNIKKIKPFKDD